MDSLGDHTCLSSQQQYKNVRASVQTVCDLSEYDKANIALLHPGYRLAGKPHLIEIFGTRLKLPNQGITALTSLAKAYNWRAFRDAYLAALKEQTELWADGARQAEQAMQAFARQVDQALKPSRGIQDGSGRARGLQAPSKALSDNKGLLERLYTALSNSIGPTGAQILPLQFPTRYLAKEEFQYELSGIYSNFTKPVVVAEAEFRLTHALYDPAAIVSAPNGRSLSPVYNQILNNFVPKYSDEDKRVREEREQPLLKYEFNSVGAGLGDSPATLRAMNAELASKNSFVRKMTRMEFASQLTQDYYDAQTKWELDRDAMIAEAITSKDPVKLAAVTRKLVHISQSEQGKLAMKNADSVVRGYSHIVREALGHLDISTPAELLQDAKDAYRTSAVASLYGASRVFPVLMSPVDWSNGLDTGFAPEDLAENPDMILMSIRSKSSSLNNLKQQLALLQGSEQGDPATLRAAVDKAAQSLEDAESTLYGKYLDSTVQLAKIAVAIATDGASTGLEEDVKDAGILEAIQGSVKSAGEVDAELKASANKLDPNGTIDDVKTQVAAVNDAQRKLQAATSAWNSKKAALARAEATSTKTDQKFLESSIASLNSELDDLNIRWSAAKTASIQRIALARAGGGKLTVEDLATKKPAPSGGSRWQEINITHEQQYSEQNSSTVSKSSSERWNVDFWIGSAGGSSESSSARFEASNKDQKLKVDISMKVTLVTVDRSSWFQPHLFENSKAYMRNSSNMHFNTYPPDAGDNPTPESIAESFRKAASPTTLSNSALPVYPVGYILCKDVFIKCSNMSVESKEEKEHLLEKSQSSGGFLCFSYNKASESSKDSSKASFEMSNDGMLVRIPGPQILGYIQQVVPKDDSIAYDATQSLGKEFYLPPPPDPSNAKNSAASHAVRDPKEASLPAPRFDIPRTDRASEGEKPHSVMPKPEDKDDPVILSEDELASHILHKLKTDNGSFKDDLKKALGISSS